MRAYGCPSAGHVERSVAPLLVVGAAERADRRRRRRRHPVDRRGRAGRAVGAARPPRGPGRPGRHGGVHAPAALPPGRAGSRDRRALAGRRDRSTVGRRHALVERVTRLLIIRVKAAAPDVGWNRSDAAVRRSNSSSVRSMSPAAAFASSWATLDAPGMATTFGLWISHASAIWAGVAPWAAATSRSALRSSAPRATFSGRNSALPARTPPGRFVPSHLAERKPCPRGLYAMTMRSLAWAHGTISSSGARATSENWTWFDSTGPPSARSASCHRRSGKLLTPTWPT